MCFHVIQKKQRIKFENKGRDTEKNGWWQRKQINRGDITALISPLVSPVLSCSLCFLSFSSLCSLVSLLCSLFHCSFLSIHRSLFSVLCLKQTAGCTCVACSLFPCPCLRVHYAFCLQQYVMMSRASACVNLGALYDAQTHTHTFWFYYEEVKFNCVTFTGSLWASPSDTLSWRRVSREVSPFFPYPRSQTSLCRSKNKIPSVKLSALRCCASTARPIKSWKETRGTPTLARSTTFQDRAWKCWTAPSLCEGSQMQRKMQILREGFRSGVF